MQIKLENGKILDVLTDTELISHKFTQLADIKLETAKSYIDEIGRKYANQLTDSKKLTNQVRTDDLKHVLEVPPQAKGIPEKVLEHADRMRVEIREISGEALEQFNNMKFW